MVQRQYFLWDLRRQRILLVDWLARHDIVPAVGRVRWLLDRDLDAREWLTHWQHLVAETALVDAMGSRSPVTATLTPYAPLQGDTPDWPIGDDIMVALDAFLSGTSPGSIERVHVAHWRSLHRQCDRFFGHQPAHFRWVQRHFTRLTQHYVWHPRWNEAYPQARPVFWAPHRRAE